MNGVNTTTNFLESADILSNELKKRVVDLILEEFNFPFIPDEIERKLYEAIFEVIEVVLTNQLMEC